MTFEAKNPICHICKKPIGVKIDNYEEYMKNVVYCHCMADDQ